MGTRLYSESMTTVCQSALLEVQYFVARDFHLDSQLYAHCSGDALKFCGAAKNWTTEANVVGPQRNPLILPCLYQHAYHPKTASDKVDYFFHRLLKPHLILTPY